MVDGHDDVEQDVDWLVGACLLVRRDAINRVGLLDEGFFMYSEELDWARRLAEHGWKVAYQPQSKVIHPYRQSGKRDLLRRDILFHGSKLRYFPKHHRPF